MVKTGRKRKYKSVKAIQKAIEAYFEETKKITITGMALYLGFNSRQALINYEGYSEEFHYAIKGAKSRVEAYYEEHLVENNAAGSIFALKNFKWKDKSEVVVSDEDNLTNEERENMRNILRERQKTPLKLVKGA